MEMYGAEHMCPPSCASRRAIKWNYGAIKFNEKRETKSVIPEWTRQLAAPRFFSTAPIKIIMKKGTRHLVSRYISKQWRLSLGYEITE